MQRRTRKTHGQAVQGELALPKPAKKPTHGGKRENAGRKPAGPRRRVAHVTRPATTFRFPVHVTKRVRADVARLRNFELCNVLRRAFVHGCNKDAGWRRHGLLDIDEVPAARRREEQRRRN